MVCGSITRYTVTAPWVTEVCARDKEPAKRYNVKDRQLEGRDDNRLSERYTENINKVDECNIVFLDEDDGESYKAAMGVS